MIDPLTPLRINAALTSTLRDEFEGLIFIPRPEIGEQGRCYENSIRVLQFSPTLQQLGWCYTEGMAVIGQKPPLLEHGFLVNPANQTLGAVDVSLAAPENVTYFAGIVYSMQELMDLIGRNCPLPYRMCLPAWGMRGTPFETAYRAAAQFAGIRLPN